MDFFYSTDLSDFFKPEDILEVITDLKDKPFTGHFVNFNADFICLCDSEGNKSVVPTSNVKYITSHKENAAAVSELSETFKNSEISRNSDFPEPQMISAKDASDEIYSPYPKPSLKIIDKIDLDEVYRRNSKKRIAKDTYPSYQSGKYVDPLSKLYPEEMGTVKTTGKKFGFVTAADGTDLCFQSYNVIGSVFPGDKVTFTAYDHPKGRQARTVMKVTSVARMIERMEDMRFQRYGKSQIADMVAQLKESFPDNDLVAEALRDTGLDHYKVREQNFRSTAGSETPEASDRDNWLTESAADTQTAEDVAPGTEIAESATEISALSMPENPEGDSPESEI